LVRSFVILRAFFAGILGSFYRLGQAVVESSWVLQADRVRKILHRDLEYYKPVIEPTYFLRYKETMAKTRKGSWYTKKMPLDALIYILCESNIKSGEEALRQQSVEAGDAWSKEFKSQKHKEMLSQATKEWKVDVGKLASLLNPTYGAFMEKAAEMFTLTERLKKEKVKDTVLCNPDRARLFTGVTYLDADLRILLLEAHCNPELRKQFFHPSSCEDMALKQWMHTWHIWSTVEGIAVALLTSIFKEIEVSLPEERIALSADKTAECILEEAVQAFRVYADEVKEMFFNIIWFDEYGSKEDLTAVNQRRAKRFLYRFFMEKEAMEPGYFWIYPAAFHKWTTVELRADGSLTYPKFSMYPTEVTNAPRPLNEWEVAHCPWYLEVSRWATPFNEAEKKAFGQLARGVSPQFYFNAMKQGLGAQAENSAVALQLVVETQIAPLDRTRKKPTKPKSSSKRSDSTKAGKKRK